MPDSQQIPTEITLFASQLQEPLLTYDPQTGRWSGSNAHSSVWMDDATFRACAAAWCQATTWLADHPLEERQPRPSPTVNA